MSKRSLTLLSLLAGLFFISSCHHMRHHMSRSCCGKKAGHHYKHGEKDHQHKHGKKACCGKEGKHGKKACCGKEGKHGKKACCGKEGKHGKKACCGKEGKHGKKACCGKKDHKHGKKACDSCGKKGRKHGKKSCCGSGSAVGHAVVNPVQGAVRGNVHFKQKAWGKVQVTANFTGLTPNQKFGFHIHEFGNCRNKALMAGGHFNPEKQKHGGPQAMKRHLGDLGNLSSDANGKASYSAIVHGRVKKFLGRSVIVHAQADDLKSQPTGNAGARIACGVIAAALAK